MDLAAACTAPAEIVQTVFGYLLHGGVSNLAELLGYLADRVLGHACAYDPPRELPWEGLYHPDEPDGIELDDYLAARVRPRPPDRRPPLLPRPLDGREPGVVDALIAARSAGANSLPVFCYSLKDDPPRRRRASRLPRFLLDEDGRSRVDVLISTLSFTVGQLSEQGPSLAHRLVRSTSWSGSTCRCSRPSSARHRGRVGSRGRRAEPADTAMNVVLPEFDGRINTVPISFKERRAATRRLGTATVQRYVPAPTASTRRAWR